MTPIQKCIVEKKSNLNPIWLMRQAGRYLPEFREIRSKNQDFIKLCLSENLASEITLQPIERFNFDAAIIFSDILMLPYGLNQKVEFEKNFGPKLGDLNLDDLKNIDEVDFSFKLNSVYKAINITSNKINRDKKQLLLVLGGPNKYYSYDRNNLEKIFENLKNLAKKYDLQIIIIPSMRTPINTIEHASSFFDKETIIVKNVDKKAYLSALSISEFLVITCDSTSMISEAALTGKPIYVAQIQSKKDDYRFRQFRELFTKLNIIRNLEDKLEEVINFQRNKQLEQFSSMYFNKLKKSLIIYGL